MREEVEIGSETLSEPDRDLVEACARLLGADEVLLWRPAGPLALEPVDEWRSGSDGPATVPSGGRSPVEKGEGCAGRAWESGEIVAAGESTSIPIPVGDASRVRLVVELLGIDDRQPIPADDDDERLHRHMAEVVRGSQDAVLSKDLEGIVTSWNPAAEEMYGYTAEEAIGRHVSFIVPDDHENEEMQILERVCRGERLKTYETERIRKDGARINVSLTASPIESAAGEVLGASVIARDITSETRTRNAEAFLIAASRRLDRSLDPVETARTIVGTAVPSVAEICVIDFLRPDGCLGDSIAAGADPRAAAALEEIRRQSPLDPQSDHPAAQVLRAGMPMSWRDLTDPKVIEQVAQSAEHRRLIVDAGYRSAAVVPLVARGRTIGTLSFLHASSDLRYDAEDLAFLSELGDRAAMALDNAQLYDERVRIAANLQRGLRPPAPAEVRGLAISVVFEPAGEGSEIGGDFYDVLPTAEGCWVLIGDVAGKGSAAAAVSVAVRHTVRGLCRELDEPQEVLTRVNDLLREGDSLNDFATTELLKLRRREDGWSLSLAAAGHPPAVHVSAGGTRQLGGGTILGAWEAPAIATHELELGGDEILVLATDGWFEAGPVSRHRKSSCLGEILAEIGPRDVSELTERLRRDALDRSDGELKDDMVILALRSDGLTGG